MAFWTAPWWPADADQESDSGQSDVDEDMPSSLDDEGTDSEDIAQVAQTTSLEESSLISAAKEGDQDAFAALFHQYELIVYRHALRMVHDSDEAADVSQDVFVAAWRALPSFRGDSRFSTWLHTITYHRCLRSIESQRNRRAATSQVTTSHVERLANAWGTMQAHLAEQQWCQSIQDQINQLPQKYSTVLTLRHQYDQSYEEIAQTLALSIGNVKTHLFRARAMLGERLQTLEQTAWQNREALAQRLQDLTSAAKQNGEVFSERLSELASEVEQASIYLRGHLKPVDV